MIFLETYDKIRLGDFMYTIINDKKIEIITLKSFFKRAKGLMFKKDKITNIYLFPKCSSIHTFFMKQKIDLCFLDKDYKILETISNLNKNKIIIKRGYFVLEMPLNTACYLKKGDIFPIYDK